MNSKLPKVSVGEIIKHDLPSGIVVYLVAIPLCLGIAIASGANPLTGIITGIVGGCVVALLSKSELSVSGPAVGLTTIVIAAIKDIGSYEGFLLAVVFAGILQLLFGILKGGFIAYYFPTSVIKGMLAAIGFILILKQIPHILGYDMDYIGDLNFFQWDNENTFSELANAVSKFTVGAIIISTLSLAIMIGWTKVVPERLRGVPASLVAVAIAIIINEVFSLYAPGLLITKEHLVDLPILTSGDFLNHLSFPDFTKWQNKKVLITAITLALVASLESLLSTSAIDKLDPFKRKTPPNRELIAQGAGNLVAAFLGGLPMTAVIVRGAANVNSGARTKYSSFIHGVLLLVSLLLFPELINRIPLACLAAILIVIGYKLINISLFKAMYRLGWVQFIPFVVTILAVVFTNLLVGIGIGMAVAAVFILRRNLLNPYRFEKRDDDSGHTIRLTLSEEVSFLNKAHFLESLNNVPDNSDVIIDATKSKYIDDDILEVIEEFKDSAQERRINLELLGVTKPYEIFNFKEKLEPNGVNLEYQQLFENNKNWTKTMLSRDPEYFKNLAQGQSPKYLFIGCSDSRAPESEILGTKPGEVFVHRNIANLFVPTDMNLVSVLHYAVNVLKVEHIIVCGHYGCGGVKAAVDNSDHGIIDKWLKNIKDTYRLYYDELEKIKDLEARHKKLVELSVREQVYNLSMTSIVQNAWKNKQNLQVHGWVYEIAQGLIKDLEIDIRKDMKHYEIYMYENVPVKRTTGSSKG